jgi:hypothetical protein
VQGTGTAHSDDRRAGDGRKGRPTDRHSRVEYGSRRGGRKLDPHVDVGWRGERRTATKAWRGIRGALGEKMALAQGRIGALGEETARCSLEEEAGSLAPLVQAHDAGQEWAKASCVGGERGAG